MKFVRKSLILLIKVEDELLLAHEKVEVKIAFRFKDEGIILFKQTV